MTLLTTPPTYLHGVLLLTVNVLKFQILTVGGYGSDELVLVGL
jgi:hypothetical protein